MYAGGLDMRLTLLNSNDGYMKPFHGSNMPVECPVLLAQQRALDFGLGFSLTSSFAQSAKWAKDEAVRRLLPQNFTDQFAFKSTAALASLTFKKGETL